jgi:3-oxoadipate enol-lactonase
VQNVNPLGNLIIDDISIRYRLDGSEGKPWIVFSNSLMTDMSIWDHQIEALTPHFRILRYDQRGHGSSGLPTAIPTFNRLARDVEALLDHCGIAQCTYVGLSMGVPTGLALWEHAPSRVARLVLVDGQARTAPTGAAMWQERIDFARTNGMKAFADTVISRWFSADSVAAGKAEPVRQGIIATSFEGFSAMAAALQSFDMFDVLATIKVPTLLLVGENDGQAPVVMEQMHRTIPDSRFCVISDAGHIPNWERADAFDRALLEFLNP